MQHVIKKTDSILEKFLPNVKFQIRAYLESEIFDYVFKRNPDVILFENLLITEFRELPYFIFTDDRFKETSCFKHYINSCLVFERKDFKTKPLDIPEGLPVIFANDVYKKRYLKKTTRF